MAWSSLVKSATHKIAYDYIEDEQLADFAGHVAGITVAAVTLDASYPVIQTTKWVAKGAIEAVKGDSTEEKMERYEALMENKAADYLF